MILGNARIEELLDLGLTRQPAMNKQDIQPASLDVRLGRNALLLVKNSLEYSVTDSVGNRFTSFTLSRRTYIDPGDFVLVDVADYFTFPPNVAGQLRLKSSRGREGYEMLEAGWIDAGYEGRLTLELVNHSYSRLPLFPGMSMAQIIFFEVDGCTKPYAGKYKGDVLVNYSQDKLE